MSSMYCRGGIVAFIDIVSFPGSMVSKPSGQSAANALPMVTMLKMVKIDVKFFIFLVPINGYFLCFVIDHSVLFSAHDYTNPS